MYCGVCIATRTHLGVTVFRKSHANSEVMRGLCLIVSEEMFIRIKQREVAGGLEFHVHEHLLALGFPVKMSIQTSKGACMVKFGFSATPSLCSILPSLITKMQEPELPRKIELQDGIDYQPLARLEAPGHGHSECFQGIPGVGRGLFVELLGCQTRFDARLPEQVAILASESKYLRLVAKCVPLLLRRPAVIELVLDRPAQSRQECLWSSPPFRAG